MFILIQITLIQITLIKITLMFLNNKTKPYVDLYSRILLILAAILFVLNYMQITNMGYSNKYNINALLSKILVFLFIMSILYNLLRRDYYLPFLGYSVFPIKSTEPNYKNNFIKTKFKINGLPPNAKVIYWAAAPSDSTSAYSDPFVAYGSYENSGIVVSNDQGTAIAQLECPSEYYVPSKFIKKGRLLKKHFHYRYELPEYKGMFSKVFTQDLSDECK